MKKVILFFAGILFLLLSNGTNAQAQTGTDYFAGKWNVLITGLPDGDSKSLVIFERIDGKLTGAMLDEVKQTKNVFTKVEEKEKTVTAYFTASGYDCFLFLEKKDDINITGSLMDMFDCTGVRIVENKTEAK